MAKTWKEEAIRRQRGLARAAHFASGGSVADWRGRADVCSDRKKADARLACRQRITLEQ